VLRFNTVHFRTVVPRRSCGFVRRNAAVVFGFGYRRSLSRSSDDSNAVAFAGAPTRLSAHAGRASLHHRFVSARIVSARRTSALAKAVAQLQVERTGRKQRATIHHRGGLPLTNTLGVMIMTRAIFGISLLLCWGVLQAQERIVQCQGHSIIKVDNRIGAQTPFHAVFKIEGDTVTMTEGDSFRFATNYRSDSELTRPGRPGYKSNNGNLFFSLDSGRFEIFKMDFVSGVGLRSESTTGECKKFERSDVFK